MSRSLLIPILAALFALSSPISTSAATECSVGNMSGLKVNGQCVYFTKGDDPYSAFGCSANNPSGYGVSQFPCPEELLKVYEKNATAEQEKVDAEQEENEQRAQEELDKKIREAVEEYAKEQEKAGNDQTIAPQTPVMAEPAIIPREISPAPLIETTTVTPPASTLEAGTSEGGSESSSLSTSTSAHVVSDLQDETAPVSLWVRVSTFFGRLNPFSWFK